MKFLATLLCFFIIALTALPSVRAIKKTFGGCEMSNKSDVPYSCEKEKIVANLNFSPLQIIDENQIFISSETEIIYTSSKEKSNYKKIFIDEFQNKIWQPPKIYFFI